MSPDIVFSGPYYPILGYLLCKSLNSDWKYGLEETPYFATLNGIMDIGSIYSNPKIAALILNHISI